ncbi:MAG: hypothetical protein F4Y26_00495 [Gammaproteobacteria bacterium]|nr:hypothetical protein [Gammaproteobacteria bacterium]
MGYASLEKLKKYLGGGLEDDEYTDDDEVLTDALEWATDRVEDITQLKFGVAFDTERRFTNIDWRRRGNQGPRIWLDQFLIEIASITIEGNEVDDDTYFGFPVNEPPYHAVQFRWDNWPSASLSIIKDNAIVINGKWGYSTTVPKTVELATIRLAAYYYREKDSQEFETIGNEETGEKRLSKNEPKYVADLLRTKFKRRIWHGAGKP